MSSLSVGLLPRWAVVYMHSCRRKRVRYFQRRAEARRFIGKLGGKRHALLRSSWAYIP